jgi:hypothetical protein
VSEVAVISPDVGHQGHIVVGSRTCWLGVGDHESLEQAIIDQIARHALQAASLDVPGDNQTPVRHIDVPAHDPVDLLRATVICLEHERSGRRAALVVAVETAKECDQFVTDNSSFEYLEPLARIWDAASMVAS